MDIQDLDIKILWCILYGTQNLSISFFDILFQAYGKRFLGGKIQGFLITAAEDSTDIIGCDIAQNAVRGIDDHTGHFSGITILALFDGDNLSLI